MNGSIGWFLNHICEREKHVEEKGKSSAIFESNVHSSHLFDFGSRRQSLIRSNAILNRNESVLFARSVSSPAFLRRTPCLSSLEQSTSFGYSTPPRSNRIVPSPHFSRIFHQPKLLTSAELKRRFSPIRKHRRVHLGPLPTNRRTDGVVPLKRSVAPLPAVLPQLFVDQDNDMIVSLCSDVPPATTMAYSPSSFDPFACHSLKNTQENAFTISEKTLKDKLQALLKQTWFYSMCLLVRWSFACFIFIDNFHWSSISFPRQICRSCLKATTASGEGRREIVSCWCRRHKNTIVIVEHTCPKHTRRWSDSGQYPFEFD